MIKKEKMRRVVFIIVLILNIPSILGQVGIGTTNPNEAAVLDVSSTDKGILTPRMTEIQRDGISNPAKGLIIYNLTEDCLQINSGSALVPTWDCIGSGTSNNTTESSVVIADCSLNGFVGDYVHQVPLGGSVTFADRFTLTVINNGFTDANINFANGDLSFSGVNGISVLTASHSSITLTPGVGQMVEYVLEGTPESTGTLIGSWTKLGLNCTQSVEVTSPSGDANFTLPNILAAVLSVDTIFDGTTYDVQGVIDNGSNQVSIDIPYTSGNGTYAAYEGTFVTGALGEGGDENTFRISYPGGTFGSSGGVITVTIEVGGTDGSYEVLRQGLASRRLIANFDFQVNGISKGMIDLVGVGGIPDKNYSDPDYKYIYQPITDINGNIWLHNNLGADYSNTNSAHYNVNQVGVTFDDRHAYGHLLQWGRLGGDHHERISYSSSILGYSIANSIQANQVSTPLVQSPALIIPPESNWLDIQMDALWDGLGAMTNPCPEGFRVPSEAEITTLLSSETITDSSSAVGSNLALTGAGFLNASSPYLETSNTGSIGRYWTSSVSGTSARVLSITPSAVSVINNDRKRSSSVRCIKD